MNKTNTSIIVIFLLIVTSLASSTLYAAQQKTILERVRIVDDPELAKLIQIAIDNLPESRRLNTGGHTEDQQRQFKYELDVAKSKAVRIVTEKYSQIKLIDKKIEQIDKKFETIKASQDIKLELEIAKATLESARLTYIAELREGLSMIPWYPFGPKEHHELKTWLHLELLGDGTTIRIMNLKKPFFTYMAWNKSENNIMCSPEQTLQHIEKIIKQSNTLPIRLTFAEMETASDKTDNLKNKIKSMIQNAKADYETELSNERHIIEGKSIEVLPHDDNKLWERTNNRATYSFERYAAKIKRDLQRPFSLPLTLKVSQQGNLTQAQTNVTNFNKMVDQLNLNEWITIELLDY